MRGIAAAIGLSLSTVRTIVEKSKGKDRTSKRAKGQNDRNRLAGRCLICISSNLT